MNQSKGIVLTGATGGIGVACVERLSALGFTVFACGRPMSREQKLPPKAEFIELDLEQPASIAAAVSDIRSVGVPITGIVNNAGLSTAGALEDLSREDILRVLQVNLLGPVQLTMALLEDLRKTLGRIVVVGSGEGFLATPLNGPYCMSKHGLEAFAECLRLETGSSGLSLSVISPGQTETPILEKARRQFRNLAERTSEPYRHLIEPRAEMAKRVGMSPTRVADAIGKALTAKNPKPRYFVGLDSRGANFLGCIAPEFLRRFVMREILGFR